MLVVRTIEDPADSVSELISAKQSLGLCNLAFGVDPPGLYSIEPRALGGQQVRYYPHPMAACFDLAVVGGDPVTHLSALVPACVVPDQEQGLLASRLEPVAAPREKARGYGAHGSAVDEPHPSLCKFRQVQPVAGEGFGVGIVLSRLFVEEVHRVARLGPGVQARPLKARKPALILEAQNPLWMAPGEPDQPISIPFFLSYSGSGLSIQRLARFQRTPSLASVARMVSPLTCLSIRPSSKLTSATIASVQKVLCLPNLLGGWWSICRRDSALPSSKAAWTSLGREEPATRAASAFSLKSWMALRTLWEPHPRFSAIRGGCSLRALAKRIWQRLRTKASEERNPLSRASRSSFESVRTKIGGFMSTTVTHHSQPVLKMH